MKKNILLVEYDNSTIETIKEILSHSIFDITIADEGELAKEFLSKKEFDLMISAAMLPKFHGFNLSLYVSSNYPNTKVIIISGVYKGIEYKHQAITQYKANDFFEKPLNKEEFYKRILELIEVREEELKNGSFVSVSQERVLDTKKIPTMKKIEAEEKKLSSEDIFGDIIEEVEKIQPHEIEIGDKKKEESKLEEITQESKKLVKVEIIEKSREKTKEDEFVKKIDEDFEDLIKSEKKIDKSKKYKKIEDEISQKIEETLSGLGLSKKDSIAKKETIKEEEIVVEPLVKEAQGKKEDEKIVESKVKEVEKEEEDEKIFELREEEKVIEPIVKEIERDKKEEISGKEKKKIEEEIGGYDILGLIARGGMAEIFKAKKKGVKGFEKIIALKKIISGYVEDDRYIEMFVDEAKIAAELSHPNIVQIYDLGKKDDYYFIAMEYVLGKDLRLILRRLSELNRLFPEELSLYLILKVLAALNYAHSAKNNKGKHLDLVHRDVSPPNILVSFNGDIKLTDFGVSKASIKIHKTISGALKGKLLYMSPEQANGEKNIDHRSDLCSVGIILFELITGEKLFLDSSEMAVLKKVQGGKIVAPSRIKKDIDPELERIILKSIDKNREMRYQNAADMIKDIESYMVKKYDRMPDPTHIAHFISDLFKSEIAKEGIKFDLKPIPYEIKKISKEKPKAVGKVEEKKEEEVIQTDLRKREIEEKEELELKEKEERIEKELIDKAKTFEQPIEISLDKPKKEEPKPKTRPVSIEPKIRAIEREGKKKRTPLLVASILIVVVAVVVYFLMKGKSPADTSSTPIDSKPASVVQTPSDKKEDTKPMDQKEDVKQGESGTIDITKGDGTSQSRDGKTEGSPTEEFVAQKPEVIKVEKDVKSEVDQEKEKQARIKRMLELKRKQEEERKKKEEEEERKRIEEEERQNAEEEERLRKEAEEEKKRKEEEERLRKLAEEEKRQREEEARRAKEGDLVSLADVSQKPEIIYKENPVFSLTVRTKNKGWVKVVTATILVNEKGTVDKVRMISKIPDEIRIPIERMLKKFRFKPAKKDNVNVKVWVIQSIRISF